MGARQRDLAFWQQPAVRCYRLDAQQQPELALQASMQGWLTWLQTSPAAVFPSMGSFRQGWSLPGCKGAPGRKAELCLTRPRALC